MEREQINGFCNKRKCRLVIEVHPPNCIVNRLVTVVDFLSNRTLVQIQDGRTHIEILIESVIQIQAEHALVVHSEIGLVFKGDINRSTRIEHALIDDGNRTHTIVDGVVHVFGQGDAAGRHLHGALGHIHRVQLNLGAGTRLVTTFQVVLVLGGILLRQRTCSAVQCIEGIAFGSGGVGQYGAQVLAERFNGGEINLTIVGVDGTSLRGRIVDEVENTIRNRVLLLVQSIQPHQLDQCDALFVTRVEEAVGNAFVIAGVEDVQTEVIFGNLIGIQTVNVLHHQVPQRRFGIQRGALQQLDAQAVRCADLIGKFADLIDVVIADDGILESNGQHLIGGECRIQRDEAELGIDGVFGGRKQTGTLNLLIINAGSQTARTEIVVHDA